MPSLVFVDQTDARYGQIVVLDPATGQRTQLTSGPGERTWPRWSPGGDRILFLESDDDSVGFPDLVIMDSDGSNRRGLLSGEDYLIADMAWSPDGRRIALSMARNDQQSPADLYVLSTSTGALTRLHLRIPQRHLRSIDWSSKGSIAVEAVAADNSPQGAALFVLNPDGTGLRQVTTPRGGTFDLTPRWSPEGGRLLFSRETDAGRCSMNLMVMTASGDDLHRVPTSCGAYLASWWPDGAHVLYNDEVDSLFAMALNGPEQFLIARGAFMASWRPGSTPALPATGG